MEPKYASKKNRKAPERYSGGYSLIPHDVLDSPAYTSCSPRAKALLIDVARQHNGRNNGHMQLTQTWMEICRPDKQGLARAHSTQPHLPNQARRPEQRTKFFRIDVVPSQQQKRPRSGGKKF